MLAVTQRPGGLLNARQCVNAGDENVSVVFAIFDRAANIHAGAIRQVHVAHHQFGLPRIQELQSSAGVGGLFDGESAAGQEAVQGLAAVLVVIDDEDARVRGDEVPARTCQGG